MMRFIIVAIAIVAGGGAGYLTLEATRNAPAETVTVVVEEAKREVLTASVDLMRGAKVGSGHLVWTPWPEPQVSDGMILRDADPEAEAEFTGRVLRSNLYAGEPVRRQHLAKGAGGFLSTILQPGKLAIGVEISADKSAGGFILPNDRVDVLHTVIRDFDGDGTANGATRTILTNVRVLAIGQTTLESDTLVVEDGAPAPVGDGSTLEGKTATLEVTTEQGEVLLAAGASGQLTLALRAADDFGLSGIGDLAMVEGSRPAPASTGPVAIADATPRGREITIISTGVSTKVSLQTRDVR